jgi:hypothetical protein
MHISGHKRTVTCGGFAVPSMQLINFLAEQLLQQLVGSIQADW